jgi:hypothetical protein
MIVEDSLHLDALAAQTQLRFRLTGLARSEAFLRSPELLRACESLWSADGRSSGLLRACFINRFGWPARSFEPDCLLV